MSNDMKGHRGVTKFGVIALRPTDGLPPIVEKHQPLTFAVGAPAHPSLIALARLLARQAAAEFVANQQTASNMKASVR